MKQGMIGEERGCDRDLIEMERKKSRLAAKLVEIVVDLVARDV